MDDLIIFFPKDLAYIIRDYAKHYSVNQKEVKSDSVQHNVVKIFNSAFIFDEYTNCLRLQYNVYKPNPYIFKTYFNNIRLPQLCKWRWEDTERIVKFENKIILMYRLNFKYDIIVFENDEQIVSKYSLHDDIEFDHNICPKITIYNDKLFIFYKTEDYKLVIYSNENKISEFSYPYIDDVNCILIAASYNEIFIYDEDLVRTSVFDYYGKFIREWFGRHIDELFVKNDEVFVLKHAYGGHHDHCINYIEIYDLFGNFIRRIDYDSKYIPFLFGDTILINKQDPTYTMQLVYE